MEILLVKWGFYSFWVLQCQRNWNNWKTFGKYSNINIIDQYVVDKIWAGDLYGCLKWQAEGEPL